ncbi:hypothetical protein F0562_006481 [Nyssa sinensis]|uniref:Uncharacterized protein n=1 Tax=Nyssa sinensis TaxID=561372 RepID=A0A5J5APW7_9ASTE|nr:hypothetical protein F0562_006481 [Nyssa sinensis]
MGCQFSKKTENNARPPLRINSNMQVTPDLSSYESACRIDPGLKSFDSTLHERTSRVINTLAVGIEVQSLSLDSLREVTECLLETNQEVVKMILECKKDIWKNKEMFELVEDFFENSLQTLDFCTALERCLKRARDSQLIIHVALQQFEEEQREGIDGEKYYSRTLQELKNFKAAGDPFSEEFFLLFHSVYKQQVCMLEKLNILKNKLDKKLKSVKSWRRISNIIFAAAFASVLICSVVAAAITAPPVVTALAAAAAVPLGSMGKWFNSLWKRYENELKGQWEIICSVNVGTYIAIKDLDSIRVLVHRLEIEIESLLQNADFALREEEAMVLAMDEIKKKLRGFMQTIDDLSEHTDKCGRHIRRARSVLLQRIIKHPSD